jgi:TrpR-related protein YerC/YecD
MGKVKPQEMDKKERQVIIYELFRIIEKIKNKQEAINFFMGALTPSEILMLARRIQIAQLLIDGSVYDEIKSKLKVGSETIHRTDQWLNSGNEKLEKWLANLIKTEHTDKKERVLPVYHEKGLLDKYPFYRFWSDLFR